MFVLRKKAFGLCQHLLKLHRQKLGFEVNRMLKLVSVRGERQVAGRYSAVG